MTNKRAILYCRVSSDKQREETASIQTQISEGLEYIRAKGYMLVGNNYIDTTTGLDTNGNNSNAVLAYADDESSYSWTRPALEKVFSYLETNDAELFIVRDLERFGRDQYIRQQIENDLEQLGVKVEYSIRQYGDTPEGNLYKNVESAVVQFDNEQRALKTKNGKITNAKNGILRSGGNVTFGYRLNNEYKIPDDKSSGYKFKGGLEPIPERIEIVQQIYHWFVIDRLSLRQIAKRLNDAGVPTSKGKTWYQSTIQKMLVNPTYKGFCYYNKWYTVDNTKMGKKNNTNWKGKMTFVKRQKPKEIDKPVEQRDKDDPYRLHYIRIENEPAVSEQLWQQAQEILEYNKQYKRKTSKRFYMLNGLIICPVCQKVYSGHTKTGGANHFYRHRIDARHCCNNSINGKELENAVWDKIKQILLEPQTLISGYENMLVEAEKKNARKRSYLTTLYASRDELTFYLDNLLEQYLKQEIEITPDQYNRMKNEKENELAKVLSDIEEVEKHLVSLPDKTDLIGFEDMVEQVGDFLKTNDMTNKEKRDFLNILQVKIHIEPDSTVTLTGVFGSELLNTTS